jgi:hypothetical protein
MFVIELTVGSSWDKPDKIVASREILTDSISAAAAEAHHWLLETQRRMPGRVTHYRVRQARVILGGPRG